jgi:hypothetical protein
MYHYGSIPKESLVELQRIFRELHSLEITLEEADKYGRKLISLYICKLFSEPQRILELLEKPGRNREILTVIARIIQDGEDQEKRRQAQVAEYERRKQEKRRA